MKNLTAFGGINFFSSEHSRHLIFEFKLSSDTCEKLESFEIHFSVRVVQDNVVLSSDKFAAAIRVTQHGLEMLA